MWLIIFLAIAQPGSSIAALLNKILVEKTYDLGLCPAVKGFAEYLEKEPAVPKSCPEARGKRKKLKALAGKLVRNCERVEAEARAALADKNLCKEYAPGNEEVAPTLSPRQSSLQKLTFRLWLHSEEIDPFEQKVEGENSREACKEAYESNIQYIGLLSTSYSRMLGRSDFISQGACEPEGKSEAEAYLRQLTGAFSTDNPEWQKLREKYGKATLYPLQ